MREQVFEYAPVGFDLWDPRTDLEPGERVRLTQPVGCPQNGTMGHVFVADETGRCRGLVLRKSLRPV